MSEFIYRFRPLKRLLDNGELENQEIYFASPMSLNDPVEGYLDVFWMGDGIVWGNLFKNYLICLTHIHLLITIGAKELVLNAESIPVFLTNDKLPTDQYREKIKKICDE